VFDALVAASQLGLNPSDPERTVAVGSTSATPPGALITHPETPMPTFEELQAVLATVTRADHAQWADAEAITNAAFGDAQTANVFVVGMALQAGALPIAPEFMEEALELNGVQVDANIRALRLGRHTVVDPGGVVRMLHLAEEPDGGADAVIGMLADDLVAYQDDAYARAFREFVDTVARAESAAVPGSSVLTVAVARGLYKLMAYKDEYEVARLMLDDDGMTEAYDVADGGGRISYRLHPPMLRALGVDHKLGFGSWTRPAFRALAGGKRLRGTLADPFRWTEVRKAERQLPDEYRAAVSEVLDRLTADNLADAVHIAELPDLVRGYEGLKLRRVIEFRSRLAEAMAAFRGSGETASAPAPSGAPTPPGRNAGRRARTRAGRS
jgi:indolepyruvate ferredoxin oxidoreductase